MLFHFMSSCPPWGFLHLCLDASCAAVPIKEDCSGPTKEICQSTRPSPVFRLFRGLPRACVGGEGGGTLALASCTAQLCTLGYIHSVLDGCCYYLLVLGYAELSASSRMLELKRSEFVS